MAISRRCKCGITLRVHEKRKNNPKKRNPSLAPKIPRNYKRSQGKKVEDCEQEDQD